MKNLLNPSTHGGLGEVIQRARQMGELATTLSRNLPPELADGIVAANVRDDGQLVVICRSPAWASRLRFEADRILAAAQHSDVNATSVAVRVSQNS